MDERRGKASISSQLDDQQLSVGFVLQLDGLLKSDVGSAPPDGSVRVKTAHDVFRPSEVQLRHPASSSAAAQRVTTKNDWY